MLYADTTACLCMPFTHSALAGLVCDHQDSAALRADKLCVLRAGLCRDLGKGLLAPFKHLVWAELGLLVC